MLKSTLFALTLAAGSLGAATVITTEAQAGPRVSFGMEYGEVRHRGDRFGRFDRFDRFDRPRRRRCRPVRALRKARRMGVRGAYVHRIGRRGVVVAGHRYGRPVRVGFARAPGCPVRFARRVRGGRI